LRPVVRTVVLDRELRLGVGKIEVVPDAAGDHRMLDSRCGQAAEVERHPHPRLFSRDSARRSTSASTSETSPPPRVPKCRFRSARTASGDTLQQYASVSTAVTRSVSDGAQRARSNAARTSVVTGVAPSHPVSSGRNLSRCTRSPGQR
jgi:hypothetical protein